jgi:superfamily II DNA or RNA helicase
MNYQEISKCLEQCDEHINEGGGKITSVVLAGFNLPDNIKNLIKQDYKTVRKIVDFYYHDFQIKLADSTDLLDVLKSIDFIQNKTNSKKTLVMDFSNEILPWLKSGQFFIDIYESNAPQIINPVDITPIIPIDKFIPRENQAEAFARLESRGLETGIHCQATGCGKSFIIIRYCDYANKKIKNPKIILFTERVNILSDLFSFNKGKLSADKNKLEYWKSKGIGDLTNFDIINRVTLKKKDWGELLGKATKPTLLVINRAFLTVSSIYSKITKSDCNLILHDECHNTSSIQCHQFLTTCKSMNIPIVGFSATPLRTGHDDKAKLLEIYGKSDNPEELNLLTNYNMIYAISKELILPPEFYWYQIELYNKQKKEDLNSNEVTQEDLGSVLELLNHLVPLLQNKKLIAWCGTIGLAKKWKLMIESSYKQRKNLKNFVFGLDTSETKTQDYDYFSKCPCDESGKPIARDQLAKTDQKQMYWGNSILFCANKHREGSDIKLLDGCIFLDKVKNRGSIPFIQSIGRVLRLCPDTPGKTKGVVIDGFVKEHNNYEKQFVDKIIGYYMALENLSSISETQEGCNEKTKYDQYVEMRDIVQFDKEKETISMRLGNRNIKIHCNKLEWDQIVNKFDKVLQEKIKLSSEDNFSHKAQTLKEVFKFGPETNFIKAYRAISPADKLKFNLPDIESDEYVKLLNDKSWIDFLNIENFHYTLEELIIMIRKINKPINSKKKWKELNKLDPKIPKYPEYYYPNFSYRAFEKIGKQIQKIDL